MVKPYPPGADDENVPVGGIVTGSETVGGQPAMQLQLETGPMVTRTKTKPSGFTLVELVIIAVLIGIIAAVSIPRVSRGARNSGDATLRSNLAVMRNAVEFYASEHGGSFPGALPAGDGFGAACSADAFRNQLLKYTDAKGRVSETKDATHIYGPYLRNQIPALPVGVNRGSTDVTVMEEAPTARGKTGWVFSCKTGEIIANCADNEMDELDTPYNDY